MQVKVGREWKPMGPRSIGIGDVAWSGGFMLMVTGEHHSGPHDESDAHWESDTVNTERQAEVANPGSKGVE